MIRVEFLKSTQGWHGFRARGHAGFADPGEDIVCAAVSALTQTAVLGLTKVVGIACQVEVEEKTGTLDCLLPPGLDSGEWQQAQLVLEVLYAGLKATEREYKQFVRVKEVPYREDESSAFRH
ncbi:MAG TPA: ribosomal-processing cysteine protease Prp [Limnochordia bacterium]|nr:ribosomal-processing cysteine protease Prp [Limnochordia bacterium]